MRKFLITICLIAVSAVHLNAQWLTNHDRRLMNDKLLEMILSYENYASFSDSYMQFCYLDLFVRSDAKVYCDFVASPEYGKQITADEYAKYASQVVSVKRVEIKNLRKSDYTRKNGRYTITVEFDKTIEYEDELLTYFDSADPLIGDYHITMNCVYDSQQGMFLISEITGTSNENCLFPTGKFVIVHKKDERDNLLMVNGQTIKFNAFDDAIVTGEALPVLDDEDVITTHTIVDATERYSKVNYSYKETRLRLRASATLAPISAYSVTSKVDFQTNKSSAYEAGVGIGYAFPIAAKAKLVINTGLGLSYSTLLLGVADVRYGYELSDDTGRLYTRNYDLSYVSEGMRFTDSVLPFYLTYEQSFKNKIALTADAGIKLYLNTNTSIDTYSVKGTASMVYDGKTTDILQLPAKVSEYMVPASYMRNTYDLAAFAKLGCEYMFKTRKYLFLKIGYLYGLTESYKSGQNQWYNADEGIYPFVYSSKSVSDVAVRSFADCISYRRSALTFDLGFRMKF